MNTACAFTILLVLVGWGLSVLLLQWAWNLALVPLFGLPPLSLGEALALEVLLLFITNALARVVKR